MSHDLTNKPLSRDVTEGPERAPARAMLRAVGMGDDDFAKPLIAVASSWNEVTPCNLHLDKSHAESEARLDRVQKPALVIMGTGDIDWPDPAAEADWVARKLNGEVVLLDGAGHHPHVEYPEKVADAVTAFQKTL
jgi:pimeloyl-ACP methyl ester carboxylesterase